MNIKSKDLREKNVSLRLAQIIMAARQSFCSSYRTILCEWLSNVIMLIKIHLDIKTYMTIMEHWSTPLLKTDDKTVFNIKILRNIFLIRLFLCFLVFRWLLIVGSSTRGFSKNARTKRSELWCENMILKYNVFQTCTVGNSMSFKLWETCSLKLNSSCDLHSHT